MRVGIDTIELERFKDISSDVNKLSKIFTQNEIDYINKFSEKISHISGFFCAKEAFVKALGSGFNKDITPIDVEVLHMSSGKPYLNILCKSVKEEIKNSSVEISISHSKTIATAVCIIY